MFFRKIEASKSSPATISQLCEASFDTFLSKYLWKFSSRIPNFKKYTDFTPEFFFQNPFSLLANYSQDSSKRSVVFFKILKKIFISKLIFYLGLENSWRDQYGRGGGGISKNDLARDILCFSEISKLPPDLFADQKIYRFWAWILFSGTIFPIRQLFSRLK